MSSNRSESGHVSNYAAIAWAALAVAILALLIAVGVFN